MQRRCLKCGRVNAQAVGSATEACPTCGAIHSRVEAMAARSESEAPHRPAPPGAAPREAVPVPKPRPNATPHDTEPTNLAAFAVKMRAATLYPNFRLWEKLLYFVSVAVCFMGAISAGIVVVSLGGRAVGICAGVLVFLLMQFFAAIAIELSIMLADLSDAAVRLAARDSEQ